MSRRSLFARTRNLTSLFLNNHSFLRHYRHSAPPLHSTATTSITNHFQNPCLPIGTTMAQLQQQKLLHHHHHLNLDLDLAPNSPPPPLLVGRASLQALHMKVLICGCTASATSIERCSKFGVDWEIVDTRQFENKLRQELGSSFRLSVKKHEGISYLHEVEISVDAELNKIPPNEKNCTTFGIAETFLV